MSLEQGYRLCFCLSCVCYTQRPCCEEGGGRPWLGLMRGAEGNGTHTLTGAGLFLALETGQVFCA